MKKEDGDKIYNFYLIANEIKNQIQKIKNYSIDQQIEIINQIKLILHEISPLKNEPVDCVLWVKNDNVYANDYNPNRVAPPEMELLKISIQEDGYTQPIVTFETEQGREVVDGFHRNRVGKEYEEIQKRIKGYLPVVTINQDRVEKGDRIASTIRHNRARGKHVVDAMSEIVLELKNRNWRNERIARELGMDEDEILRLCQITGLEDIFKDEDFTKSWDIGDSEVDFEPLTDEITELEREENKFRTVNTNDQDRIFHTYDKWECYKAGFYKTTPPENMLKEDCEKEYAIFLSNDNLFRETLDKIINEWKNSCEHYLTNKAMNRIAWLGQASMCYAKGISHEFRSGFNLLSLEQQERANNTALEYLNKWLVKNGFEEATLEEGLGGVNRQMEIY